MLDQTRYETIQITYEDRVAVLTLNRPERLNAVNNRMHTELSRIFRDAAEDRDSRALVLTGAGRGFCAGGDFKPDGVKLTGQAQVHSEGQLIVDSLIELPKPIVAAVNGPAAGLGATLALLCDWVVAAESARIGDTHVNIALTAGDGGAVIWPLLVGINRAKYYLMTAELIGARQALELGLVNAVVADGEVLPEALRLAQRLAAGPAYAIQSTKASVNQILRFVSNLVLPHSLAVERVSTTLPDHQEAVTAFQERRQPRFD